jgi:hypothetical protein
MNDKAKELWREVIARDVLVPATEEERAGLQARMSDLATRLLLWKGSDGKIAMPTVGDVCLLAEAIASYNTRAILGALADGETPEPLVTLDLS